MEELIRILIVEDHPIVAEGLGLALGRQPQFAVVGTAGTIAEAGRLAGALRPNVVLMDYHLPDGTGAEAAEVVLRGAPDAAVVMLSADGSDAAMFASIEAGACGYLVKSEATAGIADAVRRAAAGEMLISAASLSGLLARRRQTTQRETQRQDLRNRLTPREREVLQFMAQGIDNRALAERLGITLATTRVHVQNVIEKLEAHSKLEAVVRANEYGLVDR